MAAQARNLVAAALAKCGRLDLRGRHARLPVALVDLHVLELQQAARVEQVMVLDDVTGRRDHNTYAIWSLPRSADLARNQGCDYKENSP